MNPQTTPTPQDRPQATQPPTSTPSPNPEPPSAPALPTPSDTRILPGEQPPPDLAAITLTPPALPPELAAPLKPHEARAVLALVAGATWAQAVDLARYPKKARTTDPPDHVRKAAEWQIRAVAYSCGISRAWIIENLVALLRRATQAEPVYDRKGNPTGEYRFDGSTAARCLELLGKEAGLFRPAGSSIPTGDVAQLLRAVAERGRPGLPGDRARVVAEQGEPAQVQAP